MHVQHERPIFLSYIGLSASQESPVLFFSPCQELHDV